MATDAQLAEWSRVAAPVMPGTEQDWSIIVNAETYPTIERQQNAIESAIEKLGGTNVRFLKFAPTRLQPQKTRARREDLPISYVPTVRGKNALWWLVRWDYHGTADSFPWLAQRHEGMLPEYSFGHIDPTQADMLLDSVGGEQKEAESPPPKNPIDAIGDGLSELGKNVTSVTTGLAIMAGVIGAIYFWEQVKRK